MDHHELRATLDEVRPNLEAAISTHFGYTEEPTLAQSCCGFATALLQTHLMRRGLQTERLIGSPPSLPPLDDQRPREHVVLRTNTGYVIDPTYSQFMNLMGYSPTQARRLPVLNECLPSQDIAAFPEEEHRKFGHAFAVHALSRRALLLSLISMETDYAPLLAASSEHIHYVYENTWDMNHYRPLPLSAEERKTALFRRADDKMRSLRA